MPTSAASSEMPISAASAVNTALNKFMMFLLSVMLAMTVTIAL